MRAVGKRNRGGAALDEAPEQIEREVDRLIERGRAKFAVDVAKRLQGKVPQTAAAATIVRAYRARVAELIARGLVREAAELGRQVAERYPTARQALEDVRIRAEVGASPERGLADLAGPRIDPARRRAVEEALRRDLSDPRAIASSPALPEGHPLKVAARTVAEALEAVTSRPVAPEELRGLGAVARRSIMGPWRFLVEALAALHRGDRGALEAALEAIPPESSPRRAVAVIRRAAGLPGGPPPGPAELGLAAMLAGEEAALRERLARLDRLIAPRTAREAVAEARSLLSALRAADPRRARSLEEALASLFFGRELGVEDLERALGREWADPELARVKALAIEGTDPEAGLGFWEEFLSESVARGTIRERSEEAALVLHRMARLAPRGGRRRPGRPRRHRSRPDRSHYLERAREAWPCPSTFRALAEHLEAIDPRAAEREAEAWRRASPGDLEPLLLLIRAAERRGSVRKALRYLDEAEAIDRLRPEVRSARFRLLLAGAEARIRDGKCRLARGDLAALRDLAQAGEGRDLYVRALEVALAAREEERGERPLEGLVPPARRALEGEADGLLPRLVAAAAAARVGVALPPSLALDGAALSGIPAGRLARALAGLASLEKALGRRFPLAPAVFERAGAALRSAPAAAAGPEAIGDCDLLALAGLAAEAGHPEVAYEATRLGLAREGPLLHRFLLERGAVLRKLDHPEAPGCLLAALALARARRDQAAIDRACAEIDGAGDDGGGTFGPFGPGPGDEEVDVAAILRRERARREPPPPPSRRRTRRRSARGAAAARFLDEVDEDEDEDEEDRDAELLGMISAMMEKIERESGRDPLAPGRPEAEPPYRRGFFHRLFGGGR